MKCLIDHVKLLKDHHLWPLTRWRHFQFTHKKPVGQRETAARLEILSENVGKAGGLYIYYKGKDCLYVGKARKLADRLKSHYYESYRKVSGDRINTWHKFFSSNTGRLDVYWSVVADESDRRIFEIALSSKLEPSFNNLKMRNKKMR